MRMNGKCKSLLRIALWAWPIVLLCSVASGAIAGAQVNAVDNEWSAAAALGLTLITAAGRDRK